MKKRELFKLEGTNITRTRKHCPKCGPGVFLAEHKDRLSCGKCGYTEFKGRARKDDSSSNTDPSEKLKEGQTKEKEIQNKKTDEHMEDNKESKDVEKENKKE